MVNVKISKKNSVAQAITLAFVGATVMVPVFAQTTIQKVEVTGSSIKRAAVEGALPIVTLTREMIEQSGVSSAADLVATLPLMQDFLSAGTSINGGGNGNRTANIHGVGQGYTLVLLNGRRMAPYGTGSSVNLDSIPLAAIERVEVLTDGASTLYGSDAIGGVINFILKKNNRDMDIDISMSRPQAGSHGSSKKFAISKGFGDLVSDNYNILLSYSHDESKFLDATERSFSKSGIVPYTKDGKQYVIAQSSGQAAPANVTVRDKSNMSVNFNPNLLVSGSCPVKGTFQLGNICRFDYASTVQLLPDMKRDAIVGAINYQISPDHLFFADVMASNFVSTARFAPPAQSQSLDINSDIFKTYVTPHLSKMGVDPKNVKSATYNFRLTDAGGRVDDWKSNAKHIALGLTGVVKGWDYSVSYTHSQNESINYVNGGFVDGLMYDDLIARGIFNPLIAPNEQTKAALAPAIARLIFGQSKSKIDMISATASTDVIKLDGGNMQLGLGADFQNKDFADMPSAISQGPNKSQPKYTNTLIGYGSSGALPFDTSRKNWGGFAEVVAPFTKSMEVTGALRFDRYNKAKNMKNYDVDGNLIDPAIQGANYNSGTFKLAASYRPLDSILLRGSIGSGIQAPTLDNITAPLTYNGSTSNEYPCPVTSGPLLPLCNGKSYYGTMSGGNSTSGKNSLRSEKSQQYSLGFRIDPIKDLSFGFDLYRVKIRDQISTLSAEEVFNNPTKYVDLFSSYYDAAAKETSLVAALTVVNRFLSLYQGIDWDHSFKSATPIGKFTVNWTGSYLLKNETMQPNEAPTTYIGKWESGSVNFRWITRISTSLRTSDRYTHSLTLNVHPGYHDRTWTVASGIARAVNADGSYGAAVESARDVGHYAVLNWQTKANLNKNLGVTVGIKNLMNVNPPYAQGTLGNMYGYNSSYTDPLGRQFYLHMNYKH